MTEDDHRYWTRFHIPLQMCLMTKQKSTSFLIHATSTEDFRGYTNHDKLTSAGLALYFTGFPVVGRTKTETARWTTWALVTTHLESAGIGSDSGKADQKLHLKHSNLDQKKWKAKLMSLMSYVISSHVSSWSVKPMAPNQGLPSSKNPVPVEDCWPQVGEYFSLSSVGQYMY